MLLLTPAIEGLDKATVNAPSRTAGIQSSRCLCVAHKQKRKLGKQPRVSWTQS